MNFLDYSGLQRFLDRLKTIIPTKTSDIQNDSGYLTQHNPVDSALSDTSENAVQNKVVKDALDGKSDTGHTHLASEVSGLSTVATSGSYNDLTNKPTIPTVNNAKLTIQRNGTTVKTFTANASSNVTANITVPTAVSELTNDSGYLTSASSLDSSKLTGTIDIARLPKGALERLVTVANQTARFALTTSDVQLGDTVKQLDTGVMYIVTDESKLSSADGYTEYTAGSATSVPWSGVTGKPSSFTPSSHTHGNVTNDGKLGTASRALITDSSKNVTISSVTDTELGYLSGVTSSVQTQLNGKAASSHTHLTSDVTDLLNGNHTWTGDNTFSKTIISQSNEVLSTTSTSIGIGETPANEQQKVFNFKDKNNDSLSYFRHLYKTTGASQLDFIVRNKFASGSPSTSGTIGYTSFSLELGSDGSKTGTLQATLKPSATNTYDLGTSSYKWRKVYSDDVVHTSGDESVSGTKSFNSDLNLNYASTDVDDIVNSVAGSATLDNFVHMTGNETVNGIKSFPDGVIANVTGSATSATNDGSGNVISTTYGKLGANNTWTNTNRFNEILPNSGSSYNIGSVSIHWLCLFTDSVETYSYFKLTGDRSAYIVPMWAGAGSGISFLTADATKSFYFGNYTTVANNKFVIDNTKGYLCITAGETDDKTIAEIAPINASVSNLGTSTNKWKTLNGINPGALSLPKGYTEEGADKDYIDIKSVIQTLDNTEYHYTLPDNGWICVRAEQANRVHVTLTANWAFGQSVYSPNNTTLIVTVPFRKGDQITLKVEAITLQEARFYPMQGNV